VNFLMPSNVVTGPAVVTLKRGDTVVCAVQISVELVAPGIFTSDGKAAAAQVIPDPGSDAIYLVLYCTGVRGRSDLKNVTLLIAGQTIGVQYAGQQGGFPGLDQINALVPAGLKGAGVVNLSVTVDGFESNTVTLNFR